MHESFANLFPESLHFPPYSLLWRRRRLYRVLLLLAGASARRSSSHHTLLLISYSLPASVLSSTSLPHHIVLRFACEVDVRVFSGKWKRKVSRVRSFTATACDWEAWYLRSESRLSLTMTSDSDICDSRGWWCEAKKKWLRRIEFLIIIATANGECNEIFFHSEKRAHSCLFVQPSP